MTLSAIEAAAERYADARGGLKGRMEALRQSRDDATRALLPGIREAAASAEAARSALEAEIRSAPEEFRRPKTRTCSGIKVGFRAGRPTVDWDEDVLTLIREYCPEQFERLVKVTERPVAAALAALPKGERDVLRVRVEPGEDQVVIRPADAALDKDIAALLADAARLEGGAS